MDQAGTDGSSPLHIAASEGYLAVTEALLVRGAAVDQIDANDMTLWSTFHVAVAGRLRAIETAREAGRRGDAGHFITAIEAGALELVVQWMLVLSMGARAELSARAASRLPGRPLGLSWG